MATQLATGQHPSFRLPGYAGQLLIGSLLAVAAAVLLSSALPPRVPATVAAPSVTSVNELVHWKGGGHDWLLVADAGSHELVVYDAVTGAPLRRLGADDGLARVDSIAPRGDRLLVWQRGRQDPVALSLPGLRATALASR